MIWYKNHTGSSTEDLNTACEILFIGFALISGVSFSLLAVVDIDFVDDKQTNEFNWKFWL